jgi:hypothetical protein
MRKITRQWISYKGSLAFATPLFYFVSPSSEHPPYSRIRLYALPNHPYCLTVPMKQLLFLLLAVACLCSCEKELSLEESGLAPVPPLIEPAPQDTAPVFQLTAFYSDIPIDFDESDDQIKLETDLWHYVLDYIKDDHYVLRNDSTVEVIQNQIKKPGLAEPVLIRTYERGQDNLGNYIMYLTSSYNQSKYRLYEWDRHHFVIGLKWKDGARVYSRFERIK